MVLYLNMSSKRALISHGKRDITWIDIVKPTRADRASIKKVIPTLHDQDIEEAFLHTLRTKTVKREHYIFLVLMTPVYHPKTRTMSIHEIDCFISKDALVTVHENVLPPFTQLLGAHQKGKKARSYPIHGTDDLLYELLMHLLQYTYPLIDSINDELELLKKKIFRGKNGKQVHDIVEEILLIRRNVTDLRKATRGHASAIQHLIKGDHHVLTKEIFHSAHQFEELIDYAKEMWGVLESNKELIDALEDANESIISHRLNGIMKTLTVVSVVLLPANLVASIFGMNAVNMPIIGHEVDFWILLSMIGTVSFTLFLFFLRKHWIR